jgi:hypothetical protein
MMIKITAICTGLCVVGLATLTAGCQLQDKKTAEQVKNMPVNCDTADGDLRMLEGEKKSTAQKISAGVRSVVPIGLVAGVVSGTAGTKYQVATGKYNQMLDDKITEIKTTCPGSTADLAQQ